ncbi:hypothetical protein Pd630_LPD15033 (plasmid) [Rhodococcus opacus PD630]|nr:hypothetical protein Pd630_LPD15033 [Rhodococcus opacus PD630]
MPATDNTVDVAASSPDIRPTQNAQFTASGWGHFKPSHPTSKGRLGPTRADKVGPDRVDRASRATGVCARRPR